MIFSKNRWLSSSKPLQILFIFFLSLAFFSCSDSEADVVSATGTVVFDFKDNESAPATRLAVFLQVTNEVPRTESFSVYNSESDYTWNVAKPGIFSGTNKNYAYSANLNAPSGESIPTGEYSVKYFDAAGNDDEAKFSVSYEKKLLTANAQNFKDFLTNPTENIAIYDDAGELLFMGKAKSAWKTNEAIQKDYKLADTKRICFVTSGNTVICMLPAEKLKEESSEQ